MQRSKTLWLSLTLLTLVGVTVFGTMPNGKLDYVCGDVNADENINLLDILYLIDFSYSNPSGPLPEPPEAGDVNSDTYVNLIDILFLIDYLYGVPPGTVPQCPPIISGENLGSSNCKDFGKMPDSIYQNQDCIGHNYDEITQTLYITHYNTAFNCCPESLYADIDIINHIITINEHEILDGEGCGCHCLFDMNYAINGIPAGIYTIKIYSITWGTHLTTIETDIDIGSEPSGIYCVTRDSYPWSYGK